MLKTNEANVLLANPPFTPHYGDPEPDRVTPESWLAMLPGVVAQVPVEQHEQFVIDLLRQLDRRGVEMAGCVADEMAGWR